MSGSIVEVRVVRVGAVVMAHQTAVPDVAYAKAECARFESLIRDLDRPAAVLMMPDRVLPPASAGVRDVYRQSVEHGSGNIGVWAAVVGGVMGFAASIATSMAAQVFARRPVPIRVFRTVPPAIAWIGDIIDLGADPAEILAAVERLRNPAFVREVRQVG